jgi:predicted permease
MLQNVAIFVALAIPGFILVKCKILKTEDTGNLSKVLSFIAMPLFVFYSTLTIPFGGDMTWRMILLGVIGIVFTACLYLLAFLLTRKESDGKKRGMLQFCMIFSNSGFLGLPLAEQVFGSFEPTAKTFLIVLNIINNIYMYTLGIYMITGDRKQMNPKKALLNPILFAFLLGLLCNLLKLPTVLPPISDFSSKLGNMVTPLSMTIIGIKLAAVPFRKIFSAPITYFSAAFKLLFSPVLAIAWILLLKLAFPIINNAMVFAFFIAFCTPTAGLSSTFADQFDSDTETAVITTLGSTILSIATISLLYWGLTAILL